MDTNKPSDIKQSVASAGSTPIETKPTTAAQPQAMDVKKPSKVVQSDETAPLPGVPRKPIVTLDMTKPDGELNIDKDTIVYLLYLLYKTNMIARNNLRNMIDEISKPLPDNVLKFLVNEAAKVGR